MSDTKQLIGQQISAFRKAKGLTQSELAEKIDLPEEMRIALAEIAKAAPEPVIRELVPIARNLMGRKR